MSEIERLTITLPAPLAADVKGAVAAGEYASASEVIREALRDWRSKRALRLQELAGLQADIDQGLAVIFTSLYRLGGAAADGAVRCFPPDGGRLRLAGLRPHQSRHPAPLGRVRALALWPAFVGTPSSTPHPGSAIIHP